MPFSPARRPLTNSPVICLALVVFVLLAPAVVVRSAQAAGVVTTAEFWQLVSDTRTEVRGAADPARLADLAARWSGVESVRLANGKRSAVDSSFVAALLKADPPDTERLAAYLDGLAAAQSQWPREEIDPAHLERLQAILARAEFQWESPEPAFWEEWLDQAARYLLNLLEKWLNLTSQAGGVVPGWLAIGMVAAVIAAILFFALRGILKNSVTEAVWDEETGQIQNLSADGALARAITLSGDGDYRQAVRYLYLSALLLLDEHGLLRYDRTQTNREVLAQVAHDPDLSAHLKAVIEIFDRVWYGFQPVDAAAYADYAERIQWLRESRQ